MVVQDRSSEPSEQSRMPSQRSLLERVQNPLSQKNPLQVVGVWVEARRNQVYGLLLDPKISAHMPLII